MIIETNRRDTFWSFAGTALSIGASLIILPFILKYLNDQDTAVYYVFTSLSGIAALFDFGFSPAIARSMAYAWSGVSSLSVNGTSQSDSATPNYLLMAKIARSCKIIYITIASVAFLLAVTLGTSYIKYITRELPGNQYLYAWILYAAALFFNILYGYFSVFLRGVGAITQVNVATVASRIIQLLSCIVLVAVGKKLIGVAISYFLCGISFGLLSNFFFYRYKGIGKSLKSFRKNVSIIDVKKILSIIWPNTWRDGIVTVSNYFLNQAMTIIASLFLSLQQTGILSLSNQLINVVATISTTLYVAYQPALQSAYANNDRYKQRRYLSMILVGFSILYLLGMIAVFVIGIPIAVWLKPTYEIDYLVIMLIAIFQYVLKRRDCYCSFISTTNRLIYMPAFLISSLICVFLSVVSTGMLKLGIWGLIGSQLLSQLLFNAWYWPRYVKHELEIDFTQIIKNGISGLKSLIINRQ